MPISLGRPAVKIVAIGLMIANCVSHYFNLHPIVLICVSLNPRCLIDLGRSRRLILSLRIQLRPINLLCNDGASRADSDFEDPDRRSDEEEGLGAKKNSAATTCSEIRGC